MSLPHRTSTVETLTPHVGFSDPVDTAGLYDVPATDLDRAELAAHIGRQSFHGSKDRRFSFAFRKTKEGKRIPAFYHVGSKSLGTCQYVKLTSKRYAAVLVIDVDVEGTHSEDSRDRGKPWHIATSVKEKIGQLVACGWGPAWVGVNPTNGKCQLIWLIEPVYANETGDSPNTRLLHATSRTLSQWLGGDLHFTHGFSRSPFYTEKNDDAYRWYRQHAHVVPLGVLIKVVRDISGIDTSEKPRQQFRSGRELITAVKTRREEAQAFKALAKDVEAELGDKLDQYAPDLIEGVKVLWISETRAARDETAFRHALKTGHRLRAAGKTMKDAAIIDAYEHAYNVAQSVGADGRQPEMPPMRDRQTMARRVRGYVLGAKTAPGTSSAPATSATTTERKALATMGRRGGQKAAQRWKTDPNSEYAQGRRKALREANETREILGKSSKSQIAAWFYAGFAQTKKWPTIPEAMEEFSVSRQTVNRALRAAGIKLPRGRKKS